MVKVEFGSSCLIKGGRAPVRVSYPRVSEYGQLQVEIFDVGVANPSAKLVFGVSPEVLETGVVQAEIDTQFLSVGIYEIKFLRLHDAIGLNITPALDFLAGRDFPRQVFEVVASDGEQRDTLTLLSVVQKKEAQLEVDFVAPVDIRVDKLSTSSEYSVFVFVRDVLIGTAMRFKHYELIPTHNGLESNDSLNFVNWFLRERTRVGAEFAYDADLASQSRQSNPVCVVHFPTLTSSSSEEVKDYCVEQTNRLLLALSLSRDAGGVVFEIVTIDHRSGGVVKFSISQSYIGNLFVGQLSGESADTIAIYLNGLDRDPLNDFLVGLYREARRERSPDFQYVRYWQILETMAESENYDSTADLLDYEGVVMKEENNKVRKSSGSVHIVFRLICESGIGSTSETWRKVNIWFAFRNAVAHHGSIARYFELSRQSVRAWAEQGYQEISKTGRDNFLWELKEDAKLLLMRRLVGREIVS